MPCAYCNHREAQGHMLRETAGPADDDNLGEVCTECFTRAADIGPTLVQPGTVAEPGPILLRSQFPNRGR